MNRDISTSPILSIIVPTHNRPQYAVHCIKSILALDAADIELIVHDSSEADTLACIATRIADGRLRYFHAAEALSMTDNHNRAMELATGQYVCLIGDDDSVLPEIVDIAYWASAHGILAISPEVVANYAWPDFRSRYFGRAHAGRLYLKRRFGRVTTRKSSNALARSLRRAALGTDGLPKIYHGIVHRSVLEKVRSIAGAYFFGTSPDVSGAIAIASVTDSFLWIDYPLTLPGASGGSNTGRSAVNKHKGTIEEDPHTKRFRNLQWPAVVPRFVSVETVWAHAAYQTLDKMAPERLRAYNFPRLYATCLLRSPEYWQLVFQAARNYVESTRRPKLTVALDIVRNFVVVCAVVFLRLLKRGVTPSAAGTRRYRSGISDISLCHAELNEMLKDDHAHQSLSALLAAVERRL